MVGAGKIKLPTLLLARYHRKDSYLEMPFPVLCVNGRVVFQDTFRGRVCECPQFNGVQFKGDGYSSCEGNTRPTQN